MHTVAIFSRLHVDGTHSATLPIAAAVALATCWGQAAGHGTCSRGIYETARTPSAIQFLRRHGQSRAEGSQELFFVIKGVQLLHKPQLPKAYSPQGAQLPLHAPRLHEAMHLVDGLSGTHV